MTVATRMVVGLVELCCQLCPSLSVPNHTSSIHRFPICVMLFKDGVAPTHTVQRWYGTNTYRVEAIFLLTLMVGYVSAGIYLETQPPTLDLDNPAPAMSRQDARCEDWELCLECAVTASAPEAVMFIQNEAVHTPEAEHMAP
jgi:hypothetical protein